MTPTERCVAVAVADSRPRRGASQRPGWRLRDRCLALGVVGALVVGETSSAVAQATMTVQPRQMATGTKNPEVGEYPLDSITGAILSVPPQCVGAKRCPLLVALPGGGQPASVMTGWLRPVADRYGFLVLAVSEGHYKPTEVDAALKEVLARFAVDPEKIAISGRCASGGAGMSYGIKNLHVFSRIASVSGGTPTAGMDPQNKTAEFLIDAGYQETGAGAFRAVNELRANGNTVRHTMTLRGHEHQGDDYDFLGRWLHESWTKPPANRTAPAVIDSPLLTTEAMTQMTAFWTAFFQEPDSIRNTARLPLIRDVVVPVGAAERPVVPMVDMAALAAKHPSVAAALKKNGLTGQQHDAYRTAIVGAVVNKSQVSTLDQNSVLAKNIAFMAEHPDEVKALASGGIESSGNFGALGGCCTSPKSVEAMGPLGIWRTP